MRALLSLQVEEIRCITEASRGIYIGMGAQLFRLIPWVISLVAVSLLVFVIGKDLDWPKILQGWRENITLVSAAIAAIALAFAAWSFVRTKSIDRRSESLKAWSEWSAGLRSERMLVNRRISHKEIEASQAASLTTPGAPFTDRAGNLLSHEEKADLLNAALAVLNGLEHLSLGVRYKVYNRDVIVRAGGTVIIATWRRFEPYIVEQRRGKNRATPCVMV